MKNFWDNKTREQKEKWLSAFFKEYPLKQQIDLKAATDLRIDDLYYQYRSHCEIQNIKIEEPCKD